MPADANAFERLIDRVLFSENGGGEGASRPWILLQALLVQNTQARSYAQRIVLRRAEERPQDLRRGGAGEARLRALVDLWPAGEREALAAAVLGGGPRVEIWSPAEQLSHNASGYSTPPRRVSTPTWGPPFSDSPEPPREQYARDSLARRGGPQVSALSSSATTATTSRPSAVPHAQEVMFATNAVDSSATTMQLSRGSGRFGREVADSSSTVQARSRAVASSLDAWHRASGLGQPHTSTPQQRLAPRSRSLPAFQDGEIHRSPQLVLDFGPSSSSGGEDGRAAAVGEHAVSDAATNTWRAVGRRASGEDNRRRGSHRRVQDESSSDEAAASRRASEEARHLARFRRHPEGKSIQEECSEIEPSWGSGPKDALAKHVGQADAECWRCLAQCMQQVAVKGILAECRSVRHAALLKSRCSISWRQCYAQLVRHHVLQLCNIISAAAAEAACVRCSAAKLQALGMAALRSQMRDAAGALAEAGRSWQRLGHLAPLFCRPGLRLGFQTWQKCSQASRRSESAAACGLRRLQSLCLHAFSVQRAQVIQRCVCMLQQCALERRNRIEAATRNLVVVMQPQFHKQLCSGFAALQATLRLRSASTCIGAVQLVRHLERFRQRTMAASFSSFHSAALRSSDTMAAECLLQAMHYARERSLRRVVGAWQFSCRHRRRLLPLLDCLTRGPQRWAWRQLWAHVIQRRCELHFGVLCAARLECVQSDREQGLEAVRANYEARLQEAWDREAISREREAVCQRGEVEAHWLLLAQRLLRVVLGAWIQARAQVRAVLGLGSLLQRKQRRQGFTALHTHSRRDATVYLETQINCFDAFVARRNVVCHRVMQRCTQQWSNELECNSLLLLVSEWRRITCHLRRVESQRYHACKILDSFAKSVLRRAAWSPWCAWQTEMQRSSCESIYESEAFEMQREQEELRSALRATQLQAEAQLESLGHEFRLQEQMRTNLAIESAAARATNCSRLWDSFASRKQCRMIRQLVKCLKQGSVPVRLRRSAVIGWRRCAAARIKDTFVQLRTAMYAAAIEQVRARSRRDEGCARTHDTQKRMAGIINMAYNVRSQRAAHELVVTFKSMADAKRRLGSLAHVCDVVRLRAGMRCFLEWERLQMFSEATRDRQEVARIGEQVSGARLLASLISTLPRSRKHEAFSKLRRETINRRFAMQRLMSCVERGVKPLRRLMQRRGVEALGKWRCEASSKALRYSAANDSLFQAHAVQWAVSRCLQRALRVWCSLSRGPTRLASTLENLGGSRLRFAWNRLRLYVLRLGHHELRSACLSAAIRRRRARRLEATMTAWRMQYCWVQRAQRYRLVNLHRRMAGRICRCALESWLAADAQQRKFRRFGSLLWRVQGSIGLCTWRSHAARTKAAVADSLLGASRQALIRQRTDCERLVEKRGIECGQRTALALLHAWHCGAAAESALRAQRATAARALAHVVATLQRNGQQSALQRWSGVTCALSVCKAADETFVCFQRDDRLDSVRQGAMILHGIVQRRGLLDLSRALHGPWRIARWQGLVRALDASSAREQRRLRSDVDLLKARLAGAEEEALRSQDLWSGEAHRNQEAQEETASIVQAIERERRQHVVALDNLNFQLQRTRDEELAAMERAQEAETSLTTEANFLEHELREARARNALLEGERRTHVRELTAARNDLAQAGIVVDQQDQAGRDREQQFDEHVRGLADHARSLEERLRQTEWATAERAKETEKTTEERAEARMRIAAVEAEEKARHAEVEIDRVIAERDRTSELQAAMADEQDRSMRRLEELLKEQADQLRRERRDHSKGLEHLKSSASHSESKTRLLEDQVSALRQQLHREQSELRASERAWASDRAALLAVVANSLPQVPRSSPQRTSSRRKCTSSPNRNSGASGGAKSTLGRPCLMSAQSRLNSNSHSWGVCPWHGNGSSAGAMAALDAAAAVQGAT